MNAAPSVLKGGQGSAPPYGNQNAAGPHRGADDAIDFDRRGLTAGDVSDVYVPMRDRYTSQIGWPDSKEFNAVKSYSHAAHRSMNRLLRRGLDSLVTAYGDKMTPETARQTQAELEPIIAAMDRAFRPLEKSTYVYRDISSLHEPLMLSDTKVFTDKGFVSTSMNPQMPFGFKDMLRVKLPKGTPVAYGQFEGVQEWEIILPRNTTFKRVGTHKMFWGTEVPDYELVQ